MIDHNFWQSADNAVSVCVCECVGVFKCVCVGVSECVCVRVG